MAETTLFEKIHSGEIPGEILYKDDLCFVLKDIKPQAPTHLLIIPIKPMPKIADAVDQDQDLLGHLMLTARKIAADHKLTDYRLVINNGPNAGQEVYHLHIHLLSGRKFSWPPG